MARIFTRSADILPAICGKLQTWIEQLIVENMETFAERVESTVQVLTVDGEGYITIGAYEIEGRGGRDVGSKTFKTFSCKETRGGFCFVRKLCKILHIFMQQFQAKYRHIE